MYLYYITCAATVSNFHTQVHVVLDGLTVYKTHKETTWW
jgi:hypothetical protein